MGKSASRRAALAALVALAIYALACWYPGAWSPDSTRVVLPVFGKEGPQRLVMVDLEGKPVREVARVGSDREVLSAASWSPDGKWIAYMRFTFTPPKAKPAKPQGKPGDKTKPKAVPVAVALVLQRADASKTRCVWSGQAPGASRGKGYIDFNQLFGPQWFSDSRSLVVQNMSPTSPAALVMDTTGRVLRQVPLKGELSLRHTVLSPDGRHVAYVAKRPKGKKTAVYLTRADLWQPREIASTGDYSGSDPVYPAPVWSPDSRWLYVAQGKKPKPRQLVGFLKRVDVTTGRTETVWQTPRAGLTGISVSAKANRLAVDYMRDTDKPDDVIGIDVVSPGGQPVPIHFSTRNSTHYSTSISPDGKWVAFCPVGGGPGRGGSGFGVIVPSDGGRPRFFVPDPVGRSLIGRFVRGRVTATLMVACMGKEKELKAVGPAPGKITTIEQTKRWPELIRVAIRDRAAPIFKEVPRWAPVVLCLAAIEEQAPDKREPFVALARQQLDAARKAHPDHPFGPALRDELERILAKKPDKPTRPATKTK